MKVNLVFWKIAYKEIFFVVVLCTLFQNVDLIDLRPGCFPHIGWKSSVVLSQ